MHEWALAESVVLAAIDTAKKEKLHTITEIHIQIGELQQIEPEIFDFALQEILKQQDKPFRNAKIVTGTEQAVLQCNTCHHTWTFADLKKKLNETEAEAIHFIPEVAFVHTRCPQCSSPDFKIIKGRGVLLSAVKGTRR